MSQLAFMAGALRFVRVTAWSAVAWQILPPVIMATFG